jgi:putative cardiolipin synthase
MHNKQFIVDNRAAVIGGRNIADEYFGFNKNYNFIDLDVVVVGPAVQELSRRYDEYWNSRIVYSGELIEGLDEQDEAELRDVAKALLAKYETQHRPFRRSHEHWAEKLAGLPAKLESGPVEVLFDAADTDTPDEVARRLDPPALESREEVVLVMAYVLPDDIILDWFKEMISRGVRVRVLTNSLATYDSSSGANFYAAGRRSLIEAGVELYELRPDAEDRVLALTGTLGGETVALHAKVVVFDQKKVFVGSLNFEPRAHAYNREDGLLIESSAIAKRFYRGAERLMEARNCWAVTLDETGQLTWTSHDGATRESPQGAFRVGSVLLGMVPMRYR